MAASWRHVGYVMILYLAGLKAFDPSLREAAQIDGANERQTFFHVVFPVMKPINIVVVVITVIESLRAFDIVYVINKGLDEALNFPGFDYDKWIPPRTAAGDYNEHIAEILKKKLMSE